MGLVNRSLHVQNHAVATANWKLQFGWCFKSYFSRTIFANFKNQKITIFTSCYFVARNAPKIFFFKCFLRKYFFSKNCKITSSENHKTKLPEKDVKEYWHFVWKCMWRNIFFNFCARLLNIPCFFIHLAGFFFVLRKVIQLAKKGCLYGWQANKDLQYGRVSAAELVQAVHEMLSTAGINLDVERQSLLQTTLTLQEQLKESQATLLLEQVCIPWFTIVSYATLLWFTIVSYVTLSNFRFLFFLIRNKLWVVHCCFSNEFCATLFQNFLSRQFSELVFLGICVKESFSDKTLKWCFDILDKKIYSKRIWY